MAGSRPGLTEFPITPPARRAKPRPGRDQANTLMANSQPARHVAYTKRRGRAHLHLPGSGDAGDLIHITLSGYARPLRDPASLLRWPAATQFHLDIDISELLVIRERVFPAPGPRDPPQHRPGARQPASDQQRIPGQRSS